MLKVVCCYTSLILDNLECAASNNEATASVAMGMQLPNASSGAIQAVPPRSYQLNPAASIYSGLPVEGVRASWL